MDITQTNLSLDCDAENFEEDVVYDLRFNAESVFRNSVADDYTLSISAEDLHDLYHRIRDIIIYGEGT